MNTPNVLIAMGENLAFLAMFITFAAVLMAAIERRNKFNRYR